MRRDHLLLQWLTIGQALENLRSMTNHPISEEDLISYCEENLCAAYIDGSGVEGDAQVASIDEVSKSVYGAGYQRILNAEVLRNSGSAASVSLRLVGPVLSDQEDDFEERVCVWDMVAVREHLMMRFKTSDILGLAEKIAANSGKSMKLDPRERKSVGMVIAVLAKMAGVDVLHPYGNIDAIRAAAASHGLVLPDHDDTIVKYLELATKK
ncbi:hypothetical protein JFT67_10110 [Pseudomonas simiae]|uniref:hypothetical protein n=1 Tax=Pseudomonas simiae TaxID=321846 RepID=UPI0018E6E5EB|nr:hypothetical protein [Pseudomonas simiae]MBJ2229391.1 hypothetical protein [Pseudomonas simiae]